MISHKYPLVSIVTTVKNLKSQNRLEVFIECLESIKKQTYRNFEHIIIDGGSSDGTQNWLLELQSTYNFKLHVIPDKSLWDGLENGTNIAKGEFINFMNSDDCFVGQRAIEIAVRKLVKSNSDWFFSSALIKKLDGTTEIFKANPLGIFHCLGIVHQSVWTSKGALLKISPFSTDHVTRENYLFIILLLNGYKSCSSKRTLVQYREGGFSFQTYGGKYLEKTKIDFGNYLHNMTKQIWRLSLEDCYSMFGWNYASNYGWVYTLKLVKKIDYFPLKVEVLLHKFKWQIVNFGWISLIKLFVKIIRKTRISLKIYLK